MNEQRLKTVLSIQSESYQEWRMFAYIIRQLNEIGCSYFVDEGNIYVTKGDGHLYPCVVAHMDTVHEIGHDLTVIQVGENLTGFNKYTMSQTGIGGDDKVGVFIALECLRYFNNIKAVFFVAEEVGCDGSYDALLEFFNDVSYVLQCDRQGNSDFITTASGVELSCKEFKKQVKPIIKSWGYKFSHGYMTDVMALKEIGLDVCAANISCGYYNPHRKDEFVNIPDVIVCLEMVMRLITSIPEKRYEHKYYKPVTKQKGYDYLYDDWGYKHGRLVRSTYDDDVSYCDCCQEKAVTTYSTEFNMQLCYKCKDAYCSRYDTA